MASIFHQEVNNFHLCKQSSKYLDKLSTYLIGTYLPAYVIPLIPTIYLALSTDQPEINNNVNRDVFTLVSMNFLQTRKVERS